MFRGHERTAVRDRRVDLEDSAHQRANRNIALAVADLTGRKPRSLQMRSLLVTTLVLLAVGCGRSTDEWLQQLKNPDVVKRRQAIRELGSRNGDVERVVAALAEALRDESGYVRRDAATTLGNFGSAAKSAAPNLSELLKDRDLGVRKAAAAALQKIDPEASAKRNAADSALKQHDPKATIKGGRRS